VENQKEKLREVVDKDYVPIRFGIFKLLFGVFVFVLWLFSIWIASVNYDQANPKSATESVSVIYLAAMFVFSVIVITIYIASGGSLWPLNWLSEYWRRNVVGYRVIHIKCFVKDEMWSEISLGKNTEVIQKFPSDHVDHKVDCECFYGKGIHIDRMLFLKIYVPLGGWGSKEVFCFPSYKYSFGGQKYRVKRYSKDGDIIYPTLYVTDWYGDRVICCFGEAISFIKLMGRGTHSWRRVTKDYLTNKKNLLQTTENLYREREDKMGYLNLSYRLFRYLDGLNQILKNKTTRLKDSLEGLSLRIYILSEIVSTLKDKKEGGLLSSVAVEPFEKELEEVKIKFRDKKAVIDKRKNRQKEKKKSKKEGVEAGSTAK